KSEKAKGKSEKCFFTFTRFWLVLMIEALETLEFTNPNLGLKLPLPFHLSLFTIFLRIAKLTAHN
ncbi:MAG: hypothetical protein V3U73_10645, partial [bacterium]